MIISFLTGGLGNQLFQYAFAFALSKAYNEKLYFDTSSYDWDTLRKFELDHFQMNIKAAHKNDIEKIKKLKPLFYDRLKYKFQRTNIPYYRLSILKEQSFAFDKNFKKFRRKNVYVEGYWQSEEYFKNYRNEILRSIYLPNIKLSVKTLNYKTLIQNTPNSISIHIRRGDYLSNSETTAFHGVCGLRYYESAIKYMESELACPTYFVFSDDKDYIEEVFGGKNNFILIKDISFDFEELILMSCCKHNIIANSSFSWWGAWLNNFSDKKVVAPKYWFANKEMNDKTTDLIPKKWKRLG
jgi:hypothetical protein